LNGSIGMSYQQRTRGSQRVNEQLNYRKGKLNIYSSGNTAYYDFQSEQKTDVPYGNLLQKQTLDQRNRPLYHRYRLGADYKITSKTISGLLSTRSTRNRRTESPDRAPAISTATGLTDTVQSTNAIGREIA